MMSFFTSDTEREDESLPHSAFYDSGVKYEPLSDITPFESVPDRDFTSIYTYAPYNDIDNPYKGGQSHQKLKSGKRKETWNLNDNHKNSRFFSYRQAEHSHMHDFDGVNTSRSLVETFVICCCYVLLFVTMPFSLVFALKFVKSFERMVVFRLGRLQTSRQPGACLIIPCVDSTRRIDVRAKAFNVPPIQTITHDNGIVELGASIYYNIKDEVAAVISVRDWNQATRNLAHTVLYRLVNKRKAKEVPNERKQLALDLKDELNRCTLAWGTLVTSVELSDVKLIKEGQSHAMQVMNTLMRPDVRSQLVDQMAGAMNLPKDELNVQILNEMMQSAFTAPGNMVDSMVGNMMHDMQPQLDTVEEEEGLQGAAEAQGCALDTCEQTPVTIDMQKMLDIVRAVLSLEMVAQVQCLYQVHCTGLGDFYIDLKNGCGQACSGRLADSNPPDVTFGLTAADFLELLAGQLSPMDAYLSGRLTVQGDVKKAMNLQLIAEQIRAKLTVAATEQQQAVNQ